MSTTLRIVSLSLSLLGGLVLLSGCATEAGSPDPMDESDSDQGAVPEDGEGNNDPTAEPQKNKAGQCCWGHCTASGAFVKPNVTQDCRERIVESCHNHGQTFLPNGDAWWGTCP